MLLTVNTINVIKEKNSFQPLECFSFLFTVLLVKLCVFCQINLFRFYKKLHAKRLESSSRFIFLFFLLPPRVPLLANTLIITSLGNVHTQELLVTDSHFFFFF